MKGYNVSLEHREQYEAWIDIIPLTNPDLVLDI